MTHQSISMIVDYYLGNHARILRFAEQLSETQLSWQATPTSLSIAFHLWHMARWADDLQATIPGMTEDLSRRLPPSSQIWETQGLSKQWRFPINEMGFGETGMGMDETQAARIKFPPKQMLLDYVRQAFAYVDASVKSITETEFLSPELCHPGMEDIGEPGNPVGSAVMDHLVHDFRHLGMMECLLGIQSGHGTASV